MEAAEYVQSNVGGVQQGVEASSVPLMLAFPTRARCPASSRTSTRVLHASCRVIDRGGRLFLGFRGAFTFDLGRKKEPGGGGGGGGEKKGDMDEASAASASGR